MPIHISWTWKTNWILLTKNRQVRLFVRYCGQRLDPSAETFISVQRASPGGGGNW